MAWPQTRRSSECESQHFGNQGRGTTTALSVLSSGHTSPSHHSAFEVNECLPELNHGGKWLTVFLPLAK